MKECEWIWTHDQRDAFEEIKDAVKKKHQNSSTSERVTQQRAKVMRPRIDLTFC